MSDFLKIFFVLCGVVAAFVFGRNYGEQTIIESKEYIKMRSESTEAEKSASELAALKTKFQDLLDSSDLKKADEVLSKIMTVFLADLSLHLSEEKEKDLSFGKAQCVAKPVVAEKQIEKKQEPIEKNQRTENLKLESWTNIKRATYKSYEWMLKNAQTNNEILRLLQKLEIKNLNQFVKQAVDTDAESVLDLEGTFKGSAKDINQNTFANLTMFFKNDHKNKSFSGKIDIHVNGQNEGLAKSFYSIGFAQKSEFGSGILVTWENRQFIQFYKLKNSEKIAGIFYERLVNGATKTIGTFILNRVDQF